MAEAAPVWTAALEVVAAATAVEDRRVSEADLDAWEEVAGLTDVVKLAAGVEGTTALVVELTIGIGT